MRRVIIVYLGNITMSLFHIYRQYIISTTASKNSIITMYHTTVTKKILADNILGPNYSIVSMFKLGDQNDIHGDNPVRI